MGSRPATAVRRERPRADGAAHGSAGRETREEYADASRSNVLVGRRARRCRAARARVRAGRRGVRGGRDEHLHDDRHHARGHARQRADPRPVRVQGRGHAAVADGRPGARRRRWTTCRCGCPTRRATSPTSPSTSGQTLDLARGAAEGLHADPLLRHDGRRLGRRRRSRCASTTARRRSCPTSTGPTGASPGTRRRTSPSARAAAAGPPTGEDGAPCSIFHRSADIPAGTKKLVAVTLPPDTDGNAERRARLPHGAHARVGGRLVRHARPLRRAELPERQDRAGLRGQRSTRPRPTATTAGTRAPSSSRSTRRTRRAAPASSRRLWRLSGGQQRSYLGAVPADHGGRVRLRVPRDRRRGQRRGLPVRPDQGRPRRARDDRGRVSPSSPSAPDGWHDGAVTLRLTANDDQGSGVDRHGVPRRRRRVDRLRRRRRRRARPARTSSSSAPATSPGNVAEPASVAVKVDKTPPVTTARINGAAPVGALLRRGAGRADPRRRRGLRRGGDGVPDRRGGRVDALHRRVRPHRARRLPGRLPLARPRRQHGELPDAAAVDRAAAVAPAGDPPTGPRSRRRSRRSSRSSGGWRPSGRCGAATSACASRARTWSRGRCSCGCRARPSRSGSGWAAGCWRKRSVRCGDGARAAVTLRPGKAVRRALKRADGRIAAIARPADAGRRTARRATGSRWCSVATELMKVTDENVLDHNSGEGRGEAMDGGSSAMRQTCRPAAAHAAGTGPIRVLRALGACAALALALVLAAGAPAQAQEAEPLKVLLFHGAERRHDPAGHRRLRGDRGRGDFVVDATGDAADINADNLADYRTVVFMNTAGDLLDDEQEAAMTGFIEDGGGFLGIGSAAQSEPGTDFFNGLIGARPSSGSSTTPAEMTVAVGDRVHPATRDLDLEWDRTDVWYQWQSRPTGQVHTVARYHATERARRRRHERRRDRPADLLVPRLPRRPLLLHRHGPHGRGVRRGGLPHASRRRAALDDRPRARRLQGDDREQLRGQEDRRGGLARRRARQQRRVARPRDRPERLGALHRPRRLPHRRGARPARAVGRPARPRLRPRRRERRHRLRLRPRLGSRGGRRHPQQRHHRAPARSPSTATAARAASARTRATTRWSTACSASRSRRTSRRRATSTSSTSRRFDPRARRRACPSRGASRRCRSRASRGSRWTWRRSSSTSTPRS